MGAFVGKKVFNQAIQLIEDRYQLARFIIAFLVGEVPSVASALPNRAASF